MRANELGVAGQCHLVGHRQDIADLHEAFDLFVQSSDYEGTPNAVLEAMAMETPLVATAAGGTAELALDEVHGWIVPVGDVTALERAIVSAIERPDVARARAAAARARVETDLSFETRTRKLEQIYLELAGPVETR
jgi:glycosyltransferase involved in cell wall biosynthesis